MQDWKMPPSTFFELFLEELRHNEGMRPYYRFLDDDGRFHFRKNYFMRRLEYVQREVGSPGGRIWDCGCGYGTTCIFLALNGYTVRGTTIEHLYDPFIPERREYWSRHGDISGFTFAHEDLFATEFSEPVYDTIIVQDTLHHLEPVDGALQVFHRALKSEGRLIAIEENGRNIAQRIRLYMRRGNKKIIELHDEELDKTITVGNENIRPFAVWQDIVERVGFAVEKHEFIRLFPPFLWSEEKYGPLQEREKHISGRNRLLRDYLFMGLNFTLVKSTETNGANGTLSS